MNLIAKVSICEFVNLVVLDFERVPEFPCHHPSNEENTYVYSSRKGKVYRWCKRCRADRELRRWHRRRGE